MVDLKNFKFVESQFGENYIYDFNRDIFEKGTLNSVYEKFLSLNDFEEESLYVFIGSDSGNLLRYLNSIDLPLGSVFLLVDDDNVIESIVNSIDCDSQQVYISGISLYREVLDEIGFKNYVYLDRVFVKKSISCEYGYFKDYAPWYWDVLYYVKDAAWKINESLMWGSFTLAQIENSPDNISSVLDLQNTISGSTVLILGAGPSLDTHLDWIVKNRERFYIFSASRISKRLLEVGIEPDFVVAIDPYERLFESSREAYTFDKDTVLISQCSVSPRFLSQWPGRKFYVGGRLPWRSELNSRDVSMKSGPTVTNFAVSLACWMGARRVLLAGIDFCFSQAGIQYAKGSAEALAGPKLNTGNLTVLTNEGLHAPTKPDFYNGAIAMNSIAGEFSQSGISFFNISKTAAFMENVPFIDPEALTLDVNLKKLNIKYSTKNDLASLKVELQDKKGVADELGHLLKQALIIHESMYVGDKVDSEKKNKLEDMEARISELDPEIYEIIRKLSARKLVRMTGSKASISDFKLEKIKQRMDMFYAGLIYGVEVFSASISKSIFKVERRLLEENASNLSAEVFLELVNSWIKSQESGRAFFDKFSHVKVKALQLAKNDFENVMNTDFASRLIEKTKRASINYLPIKLEELYQKGDLNGLLNLYESVGSDADYSDKKAFIKAYISMLQEDFETALFIFGEALCDSESLLIEQSLFHMFRLSAQLGYHQQALDALAALACLNKQYLSAYADALAANGQMVDAIDHELEYLRYFPAAPDIESKLQKWQALIGA